jgi:outer membrane immunogenic protein
MRKDQLGTCSSAKAFWRRWWVGTAFTSLALAISAHDAYAQSSLGGPLTAATASSQADAVRQNENQLIDQAVFGAAGGGRVTAGAGSAASLNTFSTGRLRGSDHEALRVPPGAAVQGNGPYPYTTRENSAFGNIVVALPGTVLGGQMKVSGFIGQSSVSLDLKSNATSILGPTQSGSASNNSIMAGGTVLWALQNTYVLASLVGSVGQSTLKDSVDDCYSTPDFDHDFCHHNRYNFNTSGIIGSVTAGQVFDLAGKAGPKLDLRGSISYAHHAGDRFTNVFTDQQKYTLSTWTGTATATLFTNITLADNALLRPYISGYVRQEWGYENQLEAIQSDGLSLGNVSFDQRHLYAGVDAGLSYTQGATTIGAAIYYEGSGDERTLGGRLGVTQKLDGAVAGTQERAFTWSGFYVGANAGGVWAESRTRTSAACLDFDGSKTFDCPFTSAFEEPPLSTNNSSLINAAGTGTLSDNGFTIGGQAGYNLQVKGFVFGLEIDAGSFGLSSSRSVAVPALLTTVTTSFETDWLVTARSRLGVPVMPNLLIYGTAGVALTNLGVGNSVTTNEGTTAASTHGLVTGWTFGGGAEWALSRNWTLRGEYLYLDFGSVTVNSPTALTQAQLDANKDFNSFRTTTDLTAHMARVGLNYKF